MSLGAVIVRQDQLALLLRRERRVQLANQLFGRLRLCFRGTCGASADCCQRGGRADRPQEITPALDLRQIKTFIALRAIIFGFVEHGVHSVRGLRGGDEARARGSNGRRQLVIVIEPPVGKFFHRAFD